MLGLILLIVLLVLIFGGSGWVGPIPRGYGYGAPGIGLLGILLIVVVILLVLHRFPT